LMRAGPLAMAAAKVMDLETAMALAGIVFCEN
jgi:hypothetical protein